MSSKNERENTNFDFIFRTVRGMQFWKGMTDEERASIRNHLRKRNIDLDIPDLILTDMSAFTLKVCNFNEDCMILMYN